MSESRIMSPPDAQLAEMEETALQMATLAGETIKDICCNYGPSNIDRSIVDRDIESRLRPLLGDRHAGDSLICEEGSPLHPIRDGFTWVIDPLDGTDNVVQSFPLCASSIGVLYAGEPVVGAIWCSLSHVLTPGVFHSRRGGLLKFNGKPVRSRPPSQGRQLAVAASLSSDVMSTWAARRTGSAALECALAAAGVFEVVQLTRPKVWDVAAGIALAFSAGLDVRSKEGLVWQSLSQFPVSDQPAANWTKQLVIGRRDAVAKMCNEVSG